MRRILLAIIASACLGGVAAAQNFDAKAVVAPPPAVIVPFEPTSTIQPVRFSRMVIQMPPAVWARLKRVDLSGPKIEVPDRLITWGDGQINFDSQMAAELFNEVAKEAALPNDTAGASLFDAATTTDLQLGARITDMKGVFCGGCPIYLVPNNAWGGEVTMRATWELYSSRDRRVLARVETVGGYEAPKKGLKGEPERLIYEAFKDNARRLIASTDFRRAVSGGAIVASTPAVSAIAFKTTPTKPRTISSAVQSVVAVFANEGHGSGFLISSDGYVLTNQHVVGASKYVKVRWSDGAETVGEVLRSDRRRDVALIKVEAGSRAPLAYRASSDVGQAVFAIGTPLDGTLQSTVTKGIVSANRTFEGQDFIQSDVAVNPGNSGGPLLAEDGTVIGITVSGQVVNGAPVGLNMFIPIQKALDALGLKPAA